MASRIQNPRLAPFTHWGGSQKYAKRLASVMSPHRRYVEPFCGAAAVFFCKPPAPESVLADLNPEVVHTHRFIKNLTPANLRALSRYPWLVSRDVYDRIQKFNPRTPAGRVWRFVMGRKVTFGHKKYLTILPNGGFSTMMQGDSIDPNYFKEFTPRYGQARIVCQDWTETLAQHDSTSTLFFLDPPYEGEWGVPKDELSAEEIAAGVRRFVKRGAFIIAFTDSPAALSAFAGMGTIFTLPVAKARRTGGFAVRPRLFLSSKKIDVSKIGGKIISPKKNGPLKLTAADIAKLSPQVRAKLGISASASDGKVSRHAKAAHGPKRFKVSYYSPMRGRRLEFLAPIAAGSPGAAKQQGRAMVTNEPKPLNFIAVEVKENRGQRSEVRGQKKNTENLFGLGKSKRGRTKKEKRKAAKRTFKADKLEARARYLRSQNPKANNGERLSAREKQPYFCADCDADLSGKPARKMKDGRTVCIRCAKVIADKMADRKQQRMFDEQHLLFQNPAIVIMPDGKRTKRNVEMGFRDASGIFHPIRASNDYLERRAGEKSHGVSSLLHSAARAGQRRAVRSGKTIGYQRRNIEMGYYAAGAFHPIRASKDYNEFRAGDFDSAAERRDRQIQRGTADVREHYAQEQKRLAKKFEKSHKSLSQFVRQQGGIAYKPRAKGVRRDELRGKGGRPTELGLLSPKETGTTGLLNKTNRQGSQRYGAEYMMDAANAEGYRDRHGEKFDNIGNFLEAVAADAGGGKKLYSQGDLQDYEFANPAVVYDIFLRGKKLDSTRAFRPSTTSRSSYEATVKKILVKGGLDPKIVVKERRLKNPATKANPISPLELAGHAATWIMGAHSAHLLMKDLKGDVTRFGKASPKKLTASEAAKRLREERRKKEQQAVGSRQKNPDGRNTINDVLGVLVRTLGMNEHRARALVREHRKSIAEKLKDGKPASPIATWLARKKEKNPALVDAIVQGAGFTLGAGAVAATGLAALESAGGRKLKRAILKNPASQAAIEKWFERERSRLIQKYVAPELIAPKQWFGLHAKYRKMTERLKGGGRKQKKNPATPGNEKLGKKFLGRKTNGEVIKLFTPPGTPKRIRYFGPITSFELMNGRTVPFPKGLAFFGGATRGKTQRYYVGLKQPFTMPNGFKANKVHDYGAIKTVNYSASKPHLYGTARVFNFYHNHGEEGGQRPHLILYNGTIGIAGGDYKIQARGIRD